MSSNNYSIHSIIAAYGLGITPHGYYIVKMMANAKGQSSNILPRENLSNLKGRIPGQVWDKLARARGPISMLWREFPCSPLQWQLAGNLAKLPAKDLNWFAFDYLCARVLYTMAYMGVKSEAASYLRTGLWAWSISVPILVLLKSANSIQGQN
ncbi:uncharacterized protein N7473_003908 [Penicillium subrubescens]|uniref:uncharacterized protein n=1 Tax=Penicillium subrubescens TaxID=1316194 RepID=UPI0025456843|nr:uncharacterized protein N7473_003908 [Penicillium subrubescens]KAJ5906992.1 hypothetical protein N7473_003908 [Penicillium subrubescens]